jgi:deoxyribodipyrimidine photo-lyase
VAPSGKALVWFRRDLRLADNPALSAAIAQGATPIPVFIWSPEEDAPWPPGSASRWWLHQSLEDLSDSLRKLGSNLILRRGPTLQALLALADESGAQSIFWNRLYEPSAVARDREIKQILRGRGFAVESFPGNLLLEPWTVRNNQGQPFRVFTAFFKACLKAPAAMPIDAPKRIAAPAKWPESLPLPDLGLEPIPDWAGGLREQWRPGETGAASQMGIFVDAGIEEYPRERDRPDRTGTSRLSPHLHFGEVSLRQIWHAAAGLLAEPYLRQIVWREFAHHLLFNYPHTAQQPLRPEFASFPWRTGAAVAANFKAWTRGNTGYPLVDAGMRELWHTGWMHNRVRMVVASFLVKDLLISWQEGAAWFWDTLVDADLANNTLGWQWVAGCGADAAPYFRIFNPMIQGQKFDPHGDYVRRWVPELAGLPAAWIHKPWQAPASLLTESGVDLGKTYPQPIVIHETARKRALAAFTSL